MVIDLFSDDMAMTTAMAMAMLTTTATATTTTKATKNKHTSGLILFACLFCISKALTAATADVVPAVVTAAADNYSHDEASVSAEISPSTSTAMAMATATATGVNRKRVALRSIDPLTRRSAAVDKHFIRFGRNDREDVDTYFSKSQDRPLPHKSINLRKREIFQNTLDDDRDHRPDAVSVNADWDAVGGNPRLSNRFTAPAVKSLLRNRDNLVRPNWSLQTKPAAVPTNRISPTCLEHLRQVGHLPLRYNVQSNDVHDDRFAGTAKYEYDDDDDDDDDVDADGVLCRIANINGNNNDDDDDDDDDDEGDEGDYNTNSGKSEQQPANSNATTDDFIHHPSVPMSRPRSVSSAGTSVVRLPHRMWRMTGSKSIANDNGFVRTSRNKFSRNLFSRYDRGRDNFMRLGRSSSKVVVNNDDAANEETSPPLVVDEADDTISWSRTRRSTAAETVAATPPFHRFARKHDSFMRLGRKHDNFLRLGRKNDANFLRLGRAASSSFIRYGRAGNDATASGDRDYHRLPRKHDNFLRLGRNSRDLGRHLRPQTKREKAENFMRLGRRDGGDRSGHSRNTFTEPRHPRRSDNFVRFGRDHSVIVNDGQTEGGFLPEPDSADVGDNASHIEDNVERSGGTGDGGDDDDMPVVLALAMPRFRRQTTDDQRRLSNSTLLDNRQTSQETIASHRSAATNGRRDKDYDVVASLRNDDVHHDDVDAAILATTSAGGVSALPLPSSAFFHLFPFSLPRLLPLLSEQTSSSSPSIQQRRVSSHSSHGQTVVPVSIPLKKR